MTALAVEVCRDIVERGFIALKERALELEHEDWAELDNLLTINVRLGDPGEWAKRRDASAIYIHLGVKKPGQRRRLSSAERKRVVADIFGYTDDSSTLNHIAKGSDQELVDQAKALIASPAFIDLLKRCNL